MAELQMPVNFMKKKWLQILKNSAAGLLAASMLLITPQSMILAQAQDAASVAAAQNIADHFSSVKTITGEFVQFGPKGLY